MSRASIQSFADSYHKPTISNQSAITKSGLTPWSRSRKPKPRSPWPLGFSIASRKFSRTRRQKKRNRNNASLAIRWLRTRAISEKLFRRQGSTIHLRLDTPVRALTRYTFRQSNELIPETFEDRCRRNKERAARHRRREIQYPIILTLRHSDKHVAQHLFYHPKVSRVSDEIGSEFRMTRPSKRHIIAQDVVLVALRIHNGS